MQIPVTHLLNVTVYVEISNRTRCFLLVKSILLRCGEEQNVLIFIFSVQIDVLKITFSESLWDQYKGSGNSLNEK